MLGQLRHGRPGLDSGSLGWPLVRHARLMLHGKRALDAAMLDVGRLVAETLMYMEREERSGPDYHPTSSGLMKWASQRGSIYVGDQKLCVEHPRLRGPEGEVVLRTYEQLKNRGGFSEELLSKVVPSIYSSASPMGRKSALSARNTLDSARIPRASKLLICGLFQKGRVLAQDGDNRYSSATTASGAPVVTPTESHRI